MWFWISALLFLVAIVYIIVSALTRTDPLNARDDAPLFVLGMASPSQAGGATASGRRKRQNAEARLKQSESDLGRERYLRMSSERAYQV